jgi:hypothetical protein
MGAALSIDDYLLPAPAIDLGLVLARASATFQKQRESLTAQRARFDDLCREARDLTPDQIRSMAEALWPAEQQLSVILVPIIEDAAVRLVRPLPPSASPSQKSMRNMIEDVQDIAAGTLEAYRDTRVRLHRLALEIEEAAGITGTEIASSEDLKRYFEKVTATE